MATFAVLWELARGKVDHMLPALKDDTKKVLKAVAIVETTNTNAMMVPTVKITEDPAEILSDYKMDGDDVAGMGLALSRSNSASTHSSSSGAYNDSLNSSGNTSMTSLVSSGTEATIGVDGKAVYQGSLLDDDNSDYSSETDNVKTSDIEPFETLDVSIDGTTGSISQPSISKAPNNLTETQCCKTAIPAGGRIEPVCGKVHIASKSSCITDLTTEVAAETDATDKKPTLVEMLNKIADVSTETDAVYYKKTADAFLDKNVDVSSETSDPECFYAADSIAAKTIEVASTDSALDDANSRILDAIINKIDELSTNSDVPSNKRTLKAADLELHTAVGATIRKVGLDYAAASDDLLVFDNVSDKIYVNHMSYPDASHFEINTDGELKPGYTKATKPVPYTPLDLLPLQPYPECATEPLEIERECFADASCPIIFIQDFSTEKLAYDPHLGGVDLAYTAMKNREKFGLQHLWIGWKPKGGKGYEREKGDEADAGAFKGLKVWCDKDVVVDEDEEEDEQDDEDDQSDEENDDDLSLSSEDESDCDSDADSSEEESDDEFDDGVDVVFG